MTWSVNQLRRWLDQVEPIADRRTAFEWLEIAPTASSLAVQEGYHRVARTRHPDLFRLSLDAVEMDRLVRMYSRVSAAYAELRDPETCAAYLRRHQAPTRSVAAGSRPGVQQVRPPTGSEPAPRMARASPAPRPAQSPPRAIPTPRLRTATSSPPHSASSSPPHPTAPQARAPEPPSHTSPRAITFYQRAQAALRGGDRVTAALNMRMALAADPDSEFLRQALAEFERKRS